MGKRTLRCRQYDELVAIPWPPGLDVPSILSQECIPSVGEASKRGDVWGMRRGVCRKGAVVAPHTKHPRRVACTNAALSIQATSVGQASLCTNELWYG